MNFVAIQIVKPVEYGPLNHALSALSGALGIAFLVGIIILVYKEYTRAVNAKVVHFKQKLNIRRKGISGQSLGRGASSESITTSEATSYIQLTDTPTSLRCSSAWTPSPVTRNSVCETPTPGNYNL